MIPHFNENFFRFLVGFSPVFAILVSRVKLDGKYFAVSELLCGGLAVFLLLDGLHWLYPTCDLAIYMVFMMVYLAIFASKFGLNQFNRTLAVSLLLTFVVTEAWEFGVVIYAYFGLFGRTVIPVFHPLNHLYVILCFVLAVKISGLHFTKTNISILLVGILSSFLFFPPLDVIPFKPGIGVYNEQFLLLRSITFLSFASVFYLWSDKHE